MPAFFIRAFGTANKKAGIFLPLIRQLAEKQANSIFIYYLFLILGAMCIS
jgi:hypothetical protein